jgi:hypothetical protein
MVDGTDGRWEEMVQVESVVTARECLLTFTFLANQLARR